jgi:heptosyltransferase I
MKNILIVKTSAIGDVIQTLPAVSYIHALFPGANIDWVIEKSCQQLLQAHPFLTRILVVDTKTWRKSPFRVNTIHALKTFRRTLREVEYDLLFDFQGNSKSALFTFLAKARQKIGFDWSSVPEKLNLLATHKHYAIDPKRTVRERYLDLVKMHLQKDLHIPFSELKLKLHREEEVRLQEILDHPHLRRKPLWMVAFGSKWKNKQLSDDTLLEFLKKLDERYSPSLLFPYGNDEEAQTAKKLEGNFPQNSLMIGDLTLPLWQALMRCVDLLLAMDSAALHLCATTQTPTFGFFGPSSAARYNPAGEQHGFFQGVCPYGITFEKRCPRLRTCDTGACIHSPTPTHFFTSFETWYKNFR